MGDLLKWLAVWFVCGMFNVAVAIAFMRGSNEKLPGDMMLAWFLLGPLGTALVFMLVVFGILARLAGISP